MSNMKVTKPFLRKKQAKFLQGVLADQRTLPNAGTILNTERIEGIPKAVPHKIPISRSRFTYCLKKSLLVQGV